jgi:S-adenosylmethionine hydrolase
MQDLLSASGLITLTTDFGTHDPFVGVMKGVIFSRYADARIVDITHSIQPQNIAEASFWLMRSYRYFPDGTVHVAVIDPGVGTDRRIVAVRSASHILLAPDNGLLADIVSRDNTTQCIAVDAEVIDRIGLHLRSATFHGRDIFAPLAAELAAGRLHFADIGTPIFDFVASPLEQPSTSNDSVVGTVITIDRFGNLLTNIEGAVLAALAKPMVIVADVEYPVVRTYADAMPGAIVGVLNAFDVLEIAQVQGNGAVALNLERGATVTLRNRSG